MVNHCIRHHVGATHAPVRTKNCRPSANALAGSGWQQTIYSSTSYTVMRNP
jgi:hypothetical protein